MGGICCVPRSEHFTEEQIPQTKVVKSKTTVCAYPSSCNLEVFYFGAKYLYTTNRTADRVINYAE